MKIGVLKSTHPAPTTTTSSDKASQLFLVSFHQKKNLGSLLYGYNKEEKWKVGFVVS